MSRVQPSLTIGVDASCWYNRRGFGRYTKELLTALTALDQRNRYVLFLDRATAARSTDLPTGPRIEVVVVETSAAAAQAASADGSRAPGDLWRMRRAVAARTDLDVFYFPAAYTYFPVRTRARVIVTKHDMTDRRYPELLFDRWRQRLLWNLKIRLAMWRADVVATVSETSRRDIIDAFGLRETAVRVVPDAVSAHFSPVPDGPARSQTLARYGITAPYLLYVGGISPHKNLETLLEAYARLITQGRDQATRLVLLGDYAGDVFLSSFRQLQERLPALGLAERVVFTGFVPDDDLPACYSGAAALVLPSLWEGFGLPALEAMACGTPVVVSRAGALPEVVGDVGTYFEPRDPAGLADRIGELLADPARRRVLGERGRARARQYTWEASARTALALFAEVAQR